jgi:hypothetical protein
MLLSTTRSFKKGNCERTDDIHMEQTFGVQVTQACGFGTDAILILHPSLLISTSTPILIPYDSLVPYLLSSFSTQLNQS